MDYIGGHIFAPAKIFVRGAVGGAEDTSPTLEGGFSSPICDFIPLLYLEFENIPEWNTLALERLIRLSVCLSVCPSW